MIDCCLHKNKCKKFTELIEELKFKTFHDRTIGIFNIANNCGIYIPEIEICKDVLKLTWRDDDRYLLIILHNKEPEIIYVIGITDDSLKQYRSLIVDEQYIKIGAELINGSHKIQHRGDSLHRR